MPTNIGDLKINLDASEFAKAIQRLNESTMMPMADALRKLGEAMASSMVAPLVPALQGAAKAAQEFESSFQSFESLNQQLSQSGAEGEQLWNALAPVNVTTDPHVHEWLDVTNHNDAHIRMVCARCGEDRVCVDVGSVRPQTEPQPKDPPEIVGETHRVIDLSD